ncbi:coiled-coil domain-containing protein 42 homolog [Cylas formicarius]|uniref:coiled-coil domain-containing protein 42 homolog n=1 Tax=Cylas formicarius TaxID=197179 RepID=UPI00295847A0|nr:coiled-coil domain-containing protein 42 homolog [Cylas formicarius]XP_060534188.1 coiled-coil domain-containing protein 42 homolog [Cylas formicarius]
MESRVIKPSYEKIHFPKRINHEYTGEHFASKAQTNTLRKPDSGDAIDRSVEITHYLAQQRLDKTMNKLNQTRKTAQEKRRSLDEQWEDLNEKENNLRQNFIRFSQFIQENKEKKERAKNKIVEQNRLRNERDLKIKELRQKCEEIARVKTAMDKNIASYKIYENFLARVVEYEPSMQNVTDLLQRFEALLTAKHELNAIQQRDMIKLEKAKSNLKQITDSYINNINTILNKITTLEERHEMAQFVTRKWGRLHHFVMGMTTDKMSELVAIKEICEKMYLEICDRKNVDAVHAGNVEQQLFVIKQAVGEYEMINKIAREKEEKELKNSMEPNVSMMA